MPTINLTQTYPTQPVSLRHRVGLALCDALRTISKSGGHPWDVREESVTTDPTNILLTPVHNLPFFVVEPTDQGDREYQPASQVRESHVFAITCRMDAVNALYDARVSLGEQLAASIEMVLGADPTLGLTAYGVSDCRTRPHTIITTTGPDCMVMLLMMVEVRQHREYGRPNG